MGKHDVDDRMSLAAHNGRWPSQLSDQFRGTRNVRDEYLSIDVGKSNQKDSLGSERNLQGQASNGI